MESFLPSEIARLVYGYLEDEGCVTAAQAFLETSIHLQECLLVSKKGRKFSTRLMGRSLSGVLDLLCEITSLVREYAEEVSWDSPGIGRLHEVLRLLQITNRDRKFINTCSGISSTSQGDETVPDGSSDTTKKRRSDKNNASEKANVCSTNELLEPSQHHNEGSRMDECAVPDPASSEEVGVPNTDQTGKQAVKNVAPGVDPAVLANMKQDGCVDSPTSGGGVPAGGGRLAVVMPPQQPPQPQQHILYQPAPYNMLYNPSVSTVYMHTMPSQPTIVRRDGLGGAAPTVVSTAQPQQQGTDQRLWGKPPQSYVLQRAVPVQTGTSKAWPKKGGGEGGGKAGNKRSRALSNSATTNSLVSKLRPIAPKITQVLENGIEVQVLHTPDNPLVDVSVGESPRRMLRSHSRPDSTDEHFPPPSPLFIDIHNIDQMK